MTKRNIIAVVLAIIACIGVITGTAIAIKRHNDAKEDETTTATETTTEVKSAFWVDKDDVDEWVKAQKFTFAFENLKADAYPTSSQASKDAYWAGVQYKKEGSDKVYVNPLLLAADTVNLSIDDKAVPSDFYDASSEDRVVPLNDRGIKNLQTLRAKLFSEDMDVYTDSVKNGKVQYNSVPSVKGGVIYNQKAGISSGNMACWVFAQHKSVDEAFSEMEKENARKENDSKTTKTADTNSTGKTVVVRQLVRCGNTITPNPPKPTPTPSTTKAPTTKAPTTKTPTTKTPTTKAPTTKTPTTKPITVPTITFPDITIPTRPRTETTTKTYTKGGTPPEQGNTTDGQKGGGTKQAKDDAPSSAPDTTAYKATNAPKKVETTTRREEVTTKPATTKPVTTKPATTNPTTQPPTATPTQKPSQKLVKDGTTTVIYADDEELLGDW